MVVFRFVYGVEMLSILPVLIASCIGLTITARALKSFDEVKKNKTLIISVPLAIGISIMTILFAYYLVALGYTAATTPVPEGLDRSDYAGYVINSSLVMDANTWICPYGLTAHQTNPVYPTIVLNLDKVPLKACSTHVYIDGYNLSTYRAIVSGLSTIFQTKTTLVNQSTNYRVLDVELNYQGQYVGDVKIKSNITLNPNLPEGLAERNNNFVWLILWLPAVNALLLLAIVSSLRISWLNMFFVAYVFAFMFHCFGILYLSLPVTPNAALQGIGKGEEKTFAGYSVEGHRVSEFAGNTPVYVFWDTSDNVVYIGKDIVIPEKPTVYLGNSKNNPELLNLLTDTNNLTVVKGYIKAGRTINITHPIKLTELCKQCLNLSYPYPTYVDVYLVLGNQTYTNRVLHLSGLVEISTNDTPSKIIGKLTKEGCVEGWLLLFPVKTDEINTTLLQDNRDIYVIVTPEITA